MVGDLPSPGPCGDSVDRRAAIPRRRGGCSTLKRTAVLHNAARFTGHGHRVSLATFCSGACGGRSWRSATGNGALIGTMRPSLRPSAIGVPVGVRRPGREGDGQALAGAAQVDDRTTQQRVSCRPRLAPYSSVTKSPQSLTVRRHDHKTGVGMQDRDVTRGVAVSRRLLAQVPALVTGFAFAGLRLAILAIFGRRTPGLNLGVTVTFALIVLGLAHPRIQAWEMSWVRRAASAPRALRRTAVSR
jgi:hypothetical protein